jgi:1,2-diacylglycerol 3-beta-glucosyltransferase
LTVLFVFLLAVIILLWLPLLSEALCVVTRAQQFPAKLPPTNTSPRLLFLVPAHNEEILISGCVRSLLEMKYPTAARRIVVIADNCSDSTARLVRALGAECLERTETTMTGKPRAIAWALTHFDLSGFDACIIVDADSTVAPDFATGIGQLAPLNDIVFQSNIGVLNEFDGWLTRLGGLLSRCRYDITYPLKQSAGINCPVMGNGMGFGTNVLMDGGWRSFSITEDSELYAIYTTMGVAIRHARTANLFAQEESTLQQGVTQRRRWLGGRMRVIRDWGWRIITSPKIGWHQKLDAFVELGLASPVIHLILSIAIAVVALVALPAPLSLWTAIGAIASVSGLAVTSLVAIWRHPQPWKTVLSFFMLPVYAIWRSLVLVSTLVTLRDTTWRRTTRTAPALPITNLPGGRR